jgi:hypothetical protein
MNRYEGLMAEEAPFVRRCFPRFAVRLVIRRVTGSKTVAVEYSLTPMVKIIIAPLGGMCRWVKRHSRTVAAEVRLLDSHQMQELPSR